MSLEAFVFASIDWSTTLSLHCVIEFGRPCRSFGGTDEDTCRDSIGAQRAADG